MQYTYDDGSTIQIAGDTVSSTPTPAGWALSDYNENFTPGAVSGGATSWTDVLKTGFSRVIDNATQRNTPQNTPANYNGNPVGVRLPAAGSFMGIPSGTLLLGALVIGGLFVAAKMVSSKG